MIHSTAIIDPRARLDSSVEIGPYTIIDANVVLGARCRVGPYVHITGHTVIGAGNVFHAGGVIGDAPQDLKYRNGPTRLLIGDNNVFREHVTIHRSNKESDDTKIGSNNYFMAHCHVAHNCHLGNHNIIANGVLLAGHATVEDQAILSGNCLVHQFVRIGTLAMMQGGSAISLDLPPFTMARGDNGICGLNSVGLRRNGYTEEQRLALKQIYRNLFCRREPLQSLLPALQNQYSSGPARLLLDFVAESKRGVCHDTRNLGKRKKSTVES